jgi:Fe-S-cluster containining protein
MRFTCQPGCVACCEQRGMVYVSGADVVRLAEYLDMSVRRFEKRYVYRTAHTARLRKPRGGRSPHAQCPFLTAHGCSVHPAKPTQCRTFPFWPELLEDAKEWRATAQWCPGMKNGELVQIEHARAQAEEMRQALPYMYEK